LRASLRLQRGKKIGFSESLRKKAKKHAFFELTLA
jgi:hypothetical protein